MERLTELSEEFAPEIIRLRREFHQCPEKAFGEKQTSQKIAEYLGSMGLEVKQGVGGTGVVALLKGGKPGKTIAVRADIDALPVTEQTNLAFAAQNNMMHACGHDSHIAIGLGTALVLKEMAAQLVGNVKFIFQPAEEIGQGAQAMIEQGVLESPTVDAIIGLHNWPDLPLGTIGVKPGPLTAAVDHFSATILGKGGHGALPEQAIDPIVIASQVVLAWQTIVSRQISPLANGVITVGTINGGDAFNIIPDKVELSGTVRSCQDDVHKLIPERMEEILSGITKAYGGDYLFKYTYQIPAVNNPAEFTDYARQVLAKRFGDEQVVLLTEATMVGEDMSVFLKKVPGTFVFLGSGAMHKLHHPQYSVDEKSLSYGVQALTCLAWDFLMGGGI